MDNHIGICVDTHVYADTSITTTAHNDRNPRGTVSFGTPGECWCNLFMDAPDITRLIAVLVDLRGKVDFLAKEGENDA